MSVYIFLIFLLCFVNGVHIRKSPIRASIPNKNYSNTIQHISNHTVYTYDPSTFGKDTGIPLWVIIISVALVMFIVFVLIGACRLNTNITPRRSSRSRQVKHLTDTHDMLPTHATIYKREPNSHVIIIK
jgi:hypothetical protein